MSWILNLGRINIKCLDVVENKEVKQYLHFTSLTFERTSVTNELYSFKPSWSFKFKIKVLHIISI